MKLFPKIALPLFRASLLLVGSCSEENTEGQPILKNQVLKQAIFNPYLVVTNLTMQKIFSSWPSNGKGNMLTYQCTIPANTNATLYLPMEVDREDSFKVIKGVEY
nr:alpha-L-rhamnosidase C-terminal domain-containing protein [uncultured Allomuricauda sp.]